MKKVALVFAVAVLVSAWLIHATEVELLRPNLAAVLPDGWTLSVFTNAQPYGFATSDITGIGFSFRGTAQVEGPKREKVTEGFYLMFTPLAYPGENYKTSAADPGPALMPDRLIDQNRRYKIYYGIVSRDEAMPTWPAWTNDVMHALHIACASVHEKFILHEAYVPPSQSSKTSMVDRSSKSNARPLEPSPTSWFGTVYSILNSPAGIDEVIGELSCPQSKHRNWAEEMLQEIRSPLNVKSTNTVLDAAGWRSWWNNAGRTNSARQLWRNFDSHYQ